MKMSHIKSKNLSILITLMMSMWNWLQTIWLTTLKQILTCLSRQSVMAKRKRFPYLLRSTNSSPQAPPQGSTSTDSLPQAPPQGSTSTNSLPQAPPQGSTSTNSLPQGPTPVDSSSTHETQTSRQRIGRESAEYWTVEAIDPQGATKRIKLKYWQVNDLPIGERVIVHFDDQSAAYGEAQGLLAGYCGILAISGDLFPISFEKWSGKYKGIPKKYFDDCFERLLKTRFKFMTTEALAKRYCKLSISKKWAAHRQSLWNTFYDPSKTHDEILSIIPDGVDQVQWAQFVNYRLNPETQERCRKNKENRSKQVIPHTGGSKPLSRKRHEMFLETGQKPSRGKLYLETHKKKDGSIVNDAAKGIVEQIEVGLTQSNVDESVISPNDVVGRVLGPEHPGRVRCMGMAAAPTNTFTSNGVRLSHLSNSINVAYTSSSNLEAAFKAYLMMKEGGIPQEVADILGLSNPRVASGSRGGSNI